MATFSSDGFDLDAVAEGNGDVVFELGGGASVVAPVVVAREDGTTTSTAAAANDDDDSNNSKNNPLFQAEEFKAQGNSEFKKGAYLEAYDLYSSAIDACPDSISAIEILRRRDEFNEQEREKAITRHRIAEETKRQRERENANTTTTTTTGTTSTAPSNQPASHQEEEETTTTTTKPEEFRLDPLPPHAETLAIYYCNRAACLLQLGRYEEALSDCDISALLHPLYVKAYVRRSTAFEKTDRTEEALRDAKTALELEPTNATLRQRVAVLQKLEDERLEKLKTETFDKLKELGNSILGNFGLSLNNFKAVQDPNTGSYSISFEQNN